jgi:hypothetical protein
MSLVLNGTTHDTKTLETPIIFNGIHITKVVANGTTVWEKYNGASSPVTITASTTLTAGVDFPASTNITVCLVGGGGSGGYAHDTTGGGYAGDVSSGTINYSSGTTISVTIGAGGAKTTDGGTTYGNSGGTTKIGGISGSGGRGGTSLNGTSPSYKGDGGNRSTCGGSNHDGSKYYDAGINSHHPDTVAYGGQTSGFGAGGSGSEKSSYGGGVGSGGGGCASNYGGAGGRGEIRLSW